GLGWRILICCFLFIGIGIINSLWTRLDYKTWYAHLIKPAFSPPSNLIVGMIWTVMYISMGISVGIIWQVAKNSLAAEKSNRAKKGIQLFIVQIIVNMIVPIFFFGFNNLYFLLAAVVTNFLLVLILIQRFYTINKT